LFYYRVERGDIRDGKFGEHFSIEGNARSGGGGDETVVGDAALLQGCI